MTYREAYDEGRKRIASDEADIECAILLEFVMGTARNDLFAHPERELSKEEEDKFFSLTERRSSGEPVQYITGKTYFYGLEFFC
ncbi:MAG: peptide chain release factor N(5)-glutamine methyltransferase, partial [Lachnospiraceae bacterium]|nr:peptide chain release factor N(5)-glutamine methyltransferase [Lachnospiraceae bacterium]